MGAIRVCTVLVALLAGGCGTLGRLDTQAEAPRPIAAYDRVIVADFAANDRRPAKDADDAARRAEAIEAGRRAFAARIAQELRATGAFAEVAQAKLQAPALQITGSVDQWEPGNLAARSLVGFVGKSEFDATVVISDLATGEELGRIVMADTCARLLEKEDIKEFYLGMKEEGVRGKRRWKKRKTWR